MILTAQQIIEGAYGLIGVFDGTSPLTQWEYQTGLSVFNDLIDSWNNLNLSIYAVSAYVLPFQPNVQVYQLGQVSPFQASVSGTTLSLAVAQTIPANTPLLDVNNLLPPNTLVASGSGTSYQLNQSGGTIAQETMGLCLQGGSPAAPTFNWNLPRPTKIERMSVQYNPSTGQQVELPIAPPFLDLEHWQDIPAKWVSSAYPTCIYNDDQFPLMNLNVWPIPTAACNAVIYAWDSLGELTGLANNVEVPMGYNDAFKKCLAMELAPYLDRAISPDLLRMATAARKAINNINDGTPTLHLDPLFGGRGSSVELQSHGRVSY